MWKEELKKMWHPFYIVLIVFLAYLFYILEFSFMLTYWPNGGLIPYYEIAGNFQDKYGATINDKEIEEIQVNYLSLVEEFDNQLLHNKTAAQYGVSTFEEYKEWERKSLEKGDKIDELSSQDRKEWDDITFFRKTLTNKDGQSLITQVEGTNDVISKIEVFQKPDKVIDEINIGLPLSTIEKKLLKASLFSEKENWRNIIPIGLISTTSNYFYQILSLSIIVMSVYIPRAFVKDKMIKLTATQWSSKQGRRIVGSQFSTAMLTSFTIITLFLAIFGGLFLTRGFGRYFSQTLNTFFSIGEIGMEFSFFNWTYGQQLILFILLIYLIGLSYGAVLFLLSNTSAHYFSLSIKVIVVGFMYNAVGSFLIKQAFFLPNKLYQWFKIPLIELYVAILIFIVGIFGAILYCKKSWKFELTDK